MSIQVTSDGKFNYDPPPLATIALLLRDLETTINDFLIGLGYDADHVEYTVYGLDLIDVIIRVDKRIDYFKVFHGMDCDEEKEAALYAYWIAKLRPIKVTDLRYRDRDGYNNQINELFAIHYLLSVLCGTGRVKLWDGHNGVKDILNHPFIKGLKYSLRFRNFSIDSMIVLADSITTDTFKE